MSRGLGVVEIAQLMDLHVDVVRASLARLEARGLVRRLSEPADAAEGAPRQVEGEGGGG